MTNQNKNQEFIHKEGKIIKKELKNILFNIVFAFLVIFITSFFYRNILITTILLAILSIIGLIKWKSWIALAIFIFAAIFGPVCETIALSFGVWSYAVSNFANIPIWLFILWGDAGVFLYETAKEFKKLGVKG